MISDEVKKRIRSTMEDYAAGDDYAKGWREGCANCIAIMDAAELSWREAEGREGTEPVTEEWLDQVCEWDDVEQTADISWSRLPSGYFLNVHCERGEVIGFYVESRASAATLLAALGIAPEAKQ